MKRYGIPSLELFVTTWNPCQVVMAIDAMFWNEPKEAEKYGDSAYQLAKQAPARLTARMLAGME